LSEKLLRCDSIFIKTKQLRNAQDENDIFCDYNPLKRWDNENEEEQKEPVEEEEEEEDEPSFPQHPSMCYKITWESSAESVREDTLSSMFYKELPREASWRDMPGTSKRNFILVARKLINTMKSWSRSFYLKKIYQIVLIMIRIRFKIKFD
jgi:hypothetical protein